MTVQAQEIITYRGEKFALIGTPLNPFLERNKNIKFEMYTTAHWRGYQGFWLLANEQLYLKDLLSSNHTFNEIFHTGEPVLADWYSGTLQFGFGDFHRSRWSGYCDNYLWLKIANGKVLEKKIVRHFNSDIKVSFGKYKGKEIDEIIYGKISRNTYTTLKKLIDCIMCFISKADYQFKV